MRHGNVALFIPHVGCPHQCSFCDQHVISGSMRAPDADEVRIALERAAAQPVELEREIAFFGGSFTAIGRGYLLSLLEAVQPFLGQNGFSGIRVSTRPDAVETEMLELLARYGVTTIELGAQSMRDEVLFLNRRGHSAADVREAAVRIRAHGFSLGLQMMTGLDGDDTAGSLYTACALAELSPDFVRIYPTVVLEGTQLSERMRKGLYSPPSVSETIPLCVQLLLFFEERGIPVIRLGLHASRDIEQRMVGGAYHPAMRELCEGERMYRSACAALCGKAAGRYLLFVRPQDASRMAGQHRKNCIRLGQAGYDVRIRRDVTLPPFAIRVEELGPLVCAEMCT